MAYIKYYPASRVKTNLRTTGNQYMLNGRPYVGLYYITYKGEAFTGANPAVGPNEPLEFVDKSPSELVQMKSKYRVPQTSKERIKASLSGDQGNTRVVSKRASVAQLKQLKSYYPIVLEEDYARGYMTRYFAKKINMNGFIIEISPTDYDIIQNQEETSYEDYLAIKMFWQVSGPTNDKRVSQYNVISGVYDTNKRVTEAKAKGFNGLIEFIGGQYTKYARLTD